MPRKQNKIGANAFRHSKEIIEDWKRGMTLKALMEKYHSEPRGIRQIIVNAVGESEYRKGAKSRTGGGSLKRKANPSYPEWADRLRA